MESIPSHVIIKKCCTIWQLISIKQSFFNKKHISWFTRILSTVEQVANLRNFNN